MTLVQTLSVMGNVTTYKMFQHIYYFW